MHYTLKYMLINCVLSLAELSSNMDALLAAPESRVDLDPDMTDKAEPEGPPPPAPPPPEAVTALWLTTESAEA